MRNVKQDLADLSGQVVNNINMNKLYQMYNEKAAKRKAKDLANEGTFRSDASLVENVSIIIATALEKDANKPLKGSLPITSTFNALQIVNTSKKLSVDAGLKALKNHLEVKWNKNKEGNITADDFNQIKSYYTKQYPRSIVCDVIDEIGKKGYITLPISDLVQVASKIENQHDFDVAMKENGLHTSQPHHVKARNFILSILNNRQNNK